MPQHVLRIIVSVLAVLFYTKISMAAQTTQQIDSPLSGIISSATIDQTVSPIVERLMAKKNIPGASVVVVKNGNIAFKKGYGVADQGNKTPMNPDTSLFQTGSVTNLFTTTAAMQLYEQGKLDLHASVNTYLKAFKVDEPFGKPITMANLLTHTGGLHYKLLTSVAPFGQTPTPLAKHLAEELPEPARTPGFVRVHSDYGIALAGHVIEAISGMSYQEYVDHHILQPLGMNNSGLILTPERSLQMAMSGASDPANFPPADFYYSQFPPATALHSSTGDIAQFMLMQLGHYDGTSAQILKPETRKLMHSRQFSANPSIDGWAYGFREARYNGHRALGHSGSWFKHLGLIMLFPDLDLGIYVVMNKRYSAIYTETTQAVVDLYAPKLEVTPTRRPTGSEQPTSPLSQFTGTYTTGQLTTTTLERLMLISEPHNIFEIKADGNALVFEGSKFDGDKYYEVEPNFFMRKDGEKNIAFATDPSTGDLYMTRTGGAGHKRITAYERLSVQAILTFVAFAGIIGGLIWHSKTGINVNAPTLHKVNIATLVICALFIPSALGIMSAAARMVLGLYFTTPWWVEIIFNIPWLVIALVIAGISLAVQKRTDINIMAQLPITTGSALYLAILVNWNLL